MNKIRNAITKLKWNNRAQSISSRPAFTVDFASLTTQVNFALTNHLLDVRERDSKKKQIAKLGHGLWLKAIHSWNNVWKNIIL
jgi:hypothetical protein